MAWDDDMPTVLRLMVNDPSSVTYTDDRLIELIVAAAFMVGSEIEGFRGTYTISISNLTISPDPTATATKDDSFVNLTLLKAACITDRGAAILAAKQGIYVKDGSSAIDLRDTLKGKLALLIKGGYCSEYEKAKLEHLAGEVAGQAVMGPFRLYPLDDFGAGGYGGETRGA